MLPFYSSHGIVKCSVCGLVFFDDIAMPEELYTESYFTGGEYLDYVADKAIIQRNFRRHLPALLRLAPHGDLFELGSAYGFFLDLARRHWTVRGVEIAPAAARHAREALGLDVRCADFLDLPDEPGRYDLACMWDTIEHLTHPVRTLEKLSRWLRPGGHLIVTTGDIGSWMARVRKSRWRLIHPPTHLYYFSSGTLRRAATSAGLTVRRLSHVGYSRSSRAMLHGMLMLGQPTHPGLYRLLTLGGAINIPVYLNFFDIMMMVAQKPVAGDGAPRTAVA